MHSNRPKLDEHGPHKRELLLGDTRRKMKKRKPVLLMELEPHQCKFPVSYVEGKHLFCGRPRLTPGAYCLEHVELATKHPRSGEPGVRRLPPAGVGLQLHGSSSSSDTTEDRRSDPLAAKLDSDFKRPPKLQTEWVGNPAE